MLAGLAGAAGLLSACGSSTPTPAASSSSGGASPAGPPASINVATNVVSANFAPVLAAQALGYFTQQNLDVTITYSGSSPLPALLAGRSDLVAFGGFSATMAAVNTGAPPISTVYNLDSGGVSLYMIGATKVKTIQDCTRVGNSGAGGAGFTWANTLQASLKTSWTNVPAANAAALQALFASGNIDCMIYVYSGTNPFVLNGTAHWLINPEDTKTYPYPTGITQSLVDQIPAGTIYGVTSWVSSHRDAVTRFLRALEMTIPALRGSPLALTKTIMQVPAYAQSVNSDMDKALLDVTHAQYYLAPNGGMIPKSSWSAVQDYVIAGGLSYVSKTDAKWAYDKFVDMGPLTAASQGLPTK
ncbi:MAG TPA: ABC transporter substrate-binding protein [Candidatus Dormibacteraeota bacterium]|jgi:ABC-type nitrate/sulfonate/bicarbonate transport system substrate-binding protein|nr:ABC transporter substrate-binding protein [Candidatus Dormibacteraeota bacterium]